MKKFKSLNILKDIFPFLWIKKERFIFWNALLYRDDHQYIFGGVTTPILLIAGFTVFDDGWETVFDDNWEIVFEDVSGIVFEIVSGTVFESPLIILIFVLCQVNFEVWLVYSCLFF